MSKYEGAKREYRQAVACTANAYSSAWPIEKCREYKAEEAAAEAALDDAVVKLMGEAVKAGRKQPYSAKYIARSLLEQEQSDE